MSPQAGFLLQDQVVPRLASAIPNAVPIIAPEDAQEVIQDGTAMAAQMMHNAERAGKKVVKHAKGSQRNRLSCGNIAYYTIVKLRNGRRSTGSSVVDVYGAGTQITGNARMTSLDDVAAVDEVNGGEIYAFHDVLAADQEDPATQAARKLDWDAFLAGLSDDDKAIINCLVEGKPLAVLARATGINSSTFQYHKERLAKAVADFMGVDILVQVQRQPQWKDSLDATRERLACHDQRRHL